MKKVILFCVLVSASLLLNSVSADIHDTNRKGYWRIELDGVIQESQYSTDRTALDAAISMWYQCENPDCKIFVVQPLIEVTGTREKVEDETGDGTGTETDTGDGSGGGDGTDGDTSGGDDGNDGTGGGDIGDADVDPPKQFTPTVSGAVGTVYTVGSVVTFTDPDAQWVSYYCCKAIAQDGTVLNPHKAAVRVEEPPFALTLDQNNITYVDGAHYELYADIGRPDGTYDSFSGTFTLDEPIVPPETPDVETRDVTLEWTIPDKRENEEPLAVSELWGYVVLYRLSPDGEVIGVGVPGGAKTSYDLDGLAADVYDFAVKAIDTNELESAPSEWLTVDLTE